MLPSIARARAKSLLRRAGLDTLASSDHERRRAEKAALALEHARAEHAMCDQRARIAQEYQQQITELEGRTARIEQEYQQQITELEGRISQSQAAIETSEGGRQHLVEELQRQHARELAAAEERFEQRLDEMRAHYRDRLAAVVHDTTNARHELMMVEVKLDIIEASINVLDRRTRVIGTLPSAVRPVRSKSLAPEAAVSRRLTDRNVEHGATSPGEAHELDTGDVKPDVAGVSQP